jgi:heme/copper-type cytochrome/quinol oxidase subunit 2
VKQALVSLAAFEFAHFHGGTKMDNVLQIVWAFMLGWFALTSHFARLAGTSQLARDVQVIEVAAKKYEYAPSPIRVKQETKVELKITSLDRTHGFKINIYPDGSNSKGDPGLMLNSGEDCFRLEKDTPAAVEFVARIPGAYSFHCCNRCGIGHGGMKGQLVVEP